MHTFAKTRYKLFATATPYYTMQPNITVMCRAQLMLFHACYCCRTVSRDIRGTLISPFEMLWHVMHTRRCVR